jgi:hypothetical protein
MPTLKVNSWLGWRKFTVNKDYNAACGVCKQAKSEQSGLPGTLQPLLVPDHAWAVISMDFIEGLPKSKQYNTILVVIDKFSKYGHFIPLTHPFTGQSVAFLKL